MTTPSAAAGAYASLARLADPSAALGKVAGEAAAGPSFGSLLKNAIGSVVEAGRKSDAQTQALATGKSNIVGGDGGIGDRGRGRGAGRGARQGDHGL
jgi:flagellar hook-basal body complex protein FliE